MKIPFRYSWRFFALLPVMLACAAKGEPPAADSAPISRVSTEDLISKLQEESDEGARIQSCGLATQFFGVIDLERTQSGVVGAQQPNVSPVMRELARRGLAALPTLLAHLTDSRPTRITVGTGFALRWFGQDYEMRHSEGSVQATANYSKVPDGQRTFETYTLKVGDLCFIEVGQIVNRRMFPVEFFGGNSLVVNSPVETPALAANVRAEWAGLTAEEHAASLEEDAIHRHAVYMPAPAGAVCRLVVYYPAKGVPLAVRLAQRTYYDYSTLSIFMDKLIAEKNGARWDPMIAGLRKRIGEAAYPAVMGLLLEMSVSPRAQIDQQFRDRKAAADTILARVYPAVNPQHPPFVNAIEMSDLLEWVRDTRGLPCPELDAAVLQLLHQLASTPIDKTPAWMMSAAPLAEICADHFGGRREYFEETRGALRDIAGQLLYTRRHEANARARRDIDDQLAMLKDRMVYEARKFSPAQQGK